jgi:hypothetical protein
MEHIDNFKNYIEKLEYISENIHLLFKYNHLTTHYESFDYKEIILVNFLKELIRCYDMSIINSIEQIIIKNCKEQYYEEYRKYKHYENAQKLRNNIKPIDKRCLEFMDFIKRIPDHIIETSYLN